MGRARARDGGGDSSRAERCEEAIYYRAIEEDDDDDAGRANVVVDPGCAWGHQGAPFFHPPYAAAASEGTHTRALR